MTENEKTSQSTYEKVENAVCLAAISTIAVFWTVEIVNRRRAKRNANKSK